MLYIGSIDCATKGTEAINYHMDIDRERQINIVIKRMKFTRLVLAHRPETLASADRVIVLQAGRTQSLPLRQEAQSG